MPEFSHADLKDIQGTILSGFGHLRYASYLFVQIADAAQGKRWLERLLPQITTSEPWERHADGTKHKPHSTLNLGLTYPALRILGMPEDALNTFEPEFAMGIAARSQILGDVGSSAPETWEVGGPNTPEVHAVIIIYANTQETVDQQRAAQRALLLETQGGAIEINEQHGHRPQSSKEPFGFFDGVSQPLIQRNRGHAEPNNWVVATGEFVLGYLNGYQEYALSPGVPSAYDRNNLLPPFPEGGIANWKDFGRHGTYMVYRKLAQDVAGFWNAMARNARLDDDGKPDVEDMIYLASKCIGRWPSGTPLTLAPEHDKPELGRESRHDEFLYQATDKEGFGCPIGAHIRRANPRDSRINETVEESVVASNRHRIVRRAVSFGEDLFPRDDVERGKIPLDLQDDGQLRGIHFFAFNASIRKQFELIQETWSNKGSFNALFDNKDPIIGDNDGTGSMTIQAKPLRRKLLNLPRFVSVLGGGYFFVPSLTALRFLSTLEG